ncbi:MAG: hypothetical protein ACD_63C00065G0003 [uncultured bacterium]|nr:MAG: hypothetical protein ACD_63C00065G0003 [uncultured bacterium]
MHDIHAANQILKKAIEEARRRKLTKISKIFVELGDIIEHGELISAKNLRENIIDLAKGTIADNAEVVIKKSNSDFLRLIEIEAN